MNSKHLALDASLSRRGRPAITIPPLDEPAPIAKPNDDTALCYRAALSKSDAAVYIGVSVSTIEALIRAGELTPVKIGDRTLIERTALESLIVRHRAA